MTKQLFHVLKDGAIFSSREASAYSDKTAQEILENLKEPNSILAIQTPTSIIPIRPTDKPLKMYPSIIGQCALEINEVENALIIQPEDFLNQISFFFECRTQETEHVPNFSVTFDQMELRTISFERFFEIVTETFDLPHTDAKLYHDDQLLGADTKISDIIQWIYQKPLIFECNLEEKGCYKLRMRRNLISEIASTEITYINDLNTLINYFKPQLEKAKLLKEDQVATIFKEIPTILSCHIHFLSSLKSRGSGFDAIVSDCFIEFSKFFKLSANFVSHYHDIAKIAGDLNEKEMQEIIDRCPLNELGRDFQSYLITPVQRLPRYILFIRELIKFTPKCHPDAAGLQIAQIKIDAVTKEIEEQKDKNEHIYSIANLQNRLEPPITLLAPARDLLEKFKIQIIEPPMKTASRLYHFTDMCLIATKLSRQSKTYQVIYDSLIMQMNYDMNWGQDTVLIVNQGKPLVVKFGSAAEKNSYVQKVTFERIRLYTNNFNKINSILWSDVHVAARPPPVTNLSAASINDDIYFIGGLAQVRNTREKVKMPLIIYNVQTNVLSHSAVLSLPFVGSSVCSYNDKLLVFGGIEKECKKPTKSVYVFDNVSSNWKIMVKIENAPPRSFHSAVMFQNKMFVFGGKNFKGDTLADTLVLDLATKSFDVLPTKGARKPPPRMSHSSVVFGNYMIIHGGRDHKKFYSDIWCLDLLKYEWTKIGVRNDVKIHKRAGHRCIIIGTTMFIIGGCNKNEEGQKMESMAFDLTTGNVEIMNDEGNVPLLTNFALGQARNKIIIYGGQDLNISSIRSSFLQLTIPERFYTPKHKNFNFNPKMLEKKPKVNREALRRAATEKSERPTKKHRNSSADKDAKNFRSDSRRHRNSSADKDDPKMFKSDRPQAVHRNSTAEIDDPKMFKSDRPRPPPMNTLPETNYAPETNDNFQPPLRRESLDPSTLISQINQVHLNRVDSTKPLKPSNSSDHIRSQSLNPEMKSALQMEPSKLVPERPLPPPPAQNPFEMPKLRAVEKRNDFFEQRSESAMLPPPTVFEKPKLRPVEQRNENPNFPPQNFMTQTGFEKPKLRPVEQRGDYPAFPPPNGFERPKLRPVEQRNDAPNIMTQTGFERPKLRPVEQRNDNPNFPPPNGFERPKLRPVEQRPGH